MKTYRIKIGENLYFKEWDEIDPVFVIDNMIGALKEARVYKTKQDAEKDNQWIEGEIVEVEESGESEFSLSQWETDREMQVIFNRKSARHKRLC